MGLFSSLFVLTARARPRLLLAVVALDALWPGRSASPALARRALGARGRDRRACSSPLWGFANARRTARVVRVDVPIAGLPAALDGFTIAQISDVHVGPTIKRPYVEAIVDAVNRLDVDLVAITGDLVDGSVRDLAAARRAARRPALARGHLLRHRQPRVLLGRGGVGRASCAGSASRVLLNEHAVVRRGDARARRRRRHRLQRRPLRPRPGAATRRAALAGSPADAAVRVLLAHQPRSAAAAEAAGFDLQLSGHTHGGQFLPWNFLVRLQQPFTAGLHRWRRMWVYTSRGTGYWGPPKRFGAPSEITLLRLVAAPPRQPAAGAGAVARRSIRPPGSEPARGLQSTGFGRRPLPRSERISPVFISEAFAQAAPAATGAADPMGARRLGSMLPLVLMFVVLYFVMIRPQMKRQKEHQAMIDALAKGDEVVTSGGVLGKVSKMGDTFVGVEVADGVEIQVQRSAVVQVMPKGTVK